MQVNMAAMKLTKKVIDKAESTGRDHIIWDSETKGFGCKVTKAGKKVFILKYRTVDGTQRKPTLGTYGSITLDQARQLAREMLAEVHSGGDPSLSRKKARRAPTVSEVCDRFVEEHAKVHNKPSSVRSVEQRIRLHIKPKLGTRKIASITHEDIERLQRDMKDKPGAANRTLALLSKMFNLCERWGLRPQHSNPCRGIARYPERKLHRDLSELETARLAKVLREAESDSAPDVSENPRAVAAIRLLMFTGCRRGEVLGLKWNEVDLDRKVLWLEDSKTGQKAVRLNSAACEVLEAQETLLGNPYVFPSSRVPGRALHDINGPWYRIRKRARLEDVRLHDLRHNYASAAVAGGLSLPMIGKLLGHKSPATTARYADLADDPAQKAAEQVGQALRAAMNRNFEGS